MSKRLSDLETNQLPIPYGHVAKHGGHTPTIPAIYYSMLALPSQ